MDKAGGVVKGVLTQTLGPWKQPVAYLSTRLDPLCVPHCLKIIVTTTTLLTKDADKLTLGQPLVITTPCATEGTLQSPPDRWMSNAWLTHFQSLLLHHSRVTFTTSTALNPATLLPTPDLEAEPHDCLEVLSHL